MAAAIQTLLRTVQHRHELDLRRRRESVGTAGSVKTQRPADDTFLNNSGDSMTDFDLRQIIPHQERQAMPSLTLACRIPLEYVIITQEDGRSLSF